MIIASYKVDKALYHAPATVHHRVMITTEHTYKNTKLVHLHLGKNLCIRLNNVLQYEYHKSIESEQYFYGKTYSKSKAKPKPTTRSTYEQKLSQFDMSQIAVEQETVEDYTYTDKKGNRDTVQIAIMSNCDRMTATIDFKDAAQYENFTCPAWITPI